jgi:RimJ/RimL family protein N-acetyltransferase
MDGSPPERIDLEGLILRRSTIEDAAMVASSVAANLDRLADWMPWANAESSSEDFQRQRMTQTRARWEDGAAYEFLAIDPDGGAHLGNFGLERRIGPGGIELGYWLAADAAGHGYATAAARALTEVALRLPGIRRVEIHCDQANLRSQAVPRRIGYRLDRIEPNDVRAPAETGQSMIWIFENP